MYVCVRACYGGQFVCVCVCVSFVVQITQLTVLHYGMG